ncbi:hypothetical protein B0H14DRAFT_3507305 [Mycena olivaceomarginata]|nr:hypothetical protein B0H14DRAFT_3507305 [Mycena olivaceomarginata]
MRIAITDPFSSLPISNSPIASASAGDDDTSHSTGGHPPAWANDSTSASVTLEASASVTLESSVVTLSSASLSPQPIHAVAMHTLTPSPTLHAAALDDSPVLFVDRPTIDVLCRRHRTRPGPAQVSSTNSAGSIVPTGSPLPPPPPPISRAQAQSQAGIVGGISVLLLLGFIMWFFRRCARKRADMRRGLGGDADEKPNGVVGPKDEESASSSPGNANPQEREAEPAIGSPLPNSNVPAIPPNEIATPIPPATSDSTASRKIATPIPPTTSDSTASWKYYITALPEMPLMSSKIAFAVDASDSTAGEVMQTQKEFVLAMLAEQISWDRHRDWGTSPEVISPMLRLLRSLKSCNMWYLLTDGEVDSPVNFARKALENGMANTPVVFVITGTDLTSTTDISVGLPVFASAPDAAIVFKNAASGEIYVVAAKGAKSLPFFPTESAFKNALEGINIVDTAHLKTGGAVYLGRAWHETHQCFVRIDLLLEQMPSQSIPENELLDLLEDETFKALALSCKTRGLVQKLRDWLLAKNEQPRDMPAIHRPHLENSSLLPSISRCLEKLTALENTGFNVDILEWSSHRSMSAAKAVSSPKVDQEPEVLCGRRRNPTLSPPIPCPPAPVNLFAVAKGRRGDDFLTYEGPILIRPDLSEATGGEKNLRVTVPRRMSVRSLLKLRYH